MRWSVVRSHHPEPFEIVMLEIHENIVTKESDLKDIGLEILGASNYHLQTSVNHTGATTTFFMGYLPNEHEKLLWNYIQPYTNTNSYKLTYINAHPANQPGEWHTDDLEGHFTALWFPDVTDICPQPFLNYDEEGGFEIENYGVISYVPNSLIVFPAHWQHRALNHEQIGKIRFSVAYKLGK